MSDTIIPVSASYDDVKSEIWEGDLILLRNRTGAPVRAAKAAWWDDELFRLDVRNDGVVTAALLEQLVRRYPGRVDVYEVNPNNRRTDYDRQGATRRLKRTVTSGVAGFCVLSDVFRALFAPLMGGFESSRAAEAIRMADRLGGGVEPVPADPDARIGLSDLAESALYRYRFTLK